MLNKYEQLVEMIENLNKYDVNSFCELGTEHTTYINKGIEKSITLFINDDKLELTLYFEYVEVETKQYKNVKSAYNYIIKMLED